MKPLVFASLFLACSGALVAQQGSASNTAGMESFGKTQPAQLTQAVTPQVNACPVEMHARQGGGMQMLRADDGTKRPVMTPSLDLTPHDQRTITSAVVTVFGYKGYGGATVPASNDLLLREKKARERASRQLTVRFKAPQPGKVTAQLSLTEFTVVESIELNALTYADGSTWKLAADAGCRVAPDPLLLVSGR